MVARRRGIGNVIASAIMVFLVIFTVSQLYIYNLDQLDNYNQIAQGVFNTNAQRQNERIGITNLQVNLNHGTAPYTMKINLTITNSGGVTSHVTAVWMDDVDSSTAAHQRVSQNLYIGSGLSTSINNLDTTVLSTANHKVKVKVLTELGNSAAVEILPPGLAGTTSDTLATSQVTLVPPNPITSNDIVVVLSVTNNNNLGVAFTSLEPDICIAQGRVAPVIATLTTGTATGGSSTTLTVSGSPWTSNQWVSDVIVITSGTGAGKSGRIASNTANTLTIVSNPPWSFTPDGTTQFSIRSDCHSSAPTVDSGTTTSGSTTTVTQTGKSWATNQWTNYVLAVISGPAAGQAAAIVSNTGNTITISPAFSISPGAGAQYEIRTTLCNANSGIVNSAPVYCSLVQGPTPSTLSYLPPGGSITFQWIYLVTTIIADSPITFTSSYVNSTTTIGLFGSQAPVQTATVRGPGGATASSGGNFQTAFGSLVNYFLSFQYSTDGTNWKTGFNIPAHTNTIFRVNITNLSSRSIAFNSTTELLLLDLKTGSSIDFFIMKACPTTYSSPLGPFQQPYFSPTTSSCTVSSSAYPSQRYIVGPSQTISLYFGATMAGGTNSQASPNAGRDSLGVIAMVGSSYAGQNTAALSGSTSLGVTLSPPISTTNYNVYVQASWVTTTSIVSKTTTGFTINFGTAAPSSCSGGPCTVSWAIYATGANTAGLNTPYSQAATFFTVNT